ncbi:hypothetical protein [Methylosarcina fibrata]|uniref:hypothetical protein n=1 Tax=Methylosarcina fibrata TaxID=105972 RepID=UPI0012F7B03B|nr:hypothetical protein [Methylosarcina fibrata]
MNQETIVVFREALNKSAPFALSLSKGLNPCFLRIESAARSVVGNLGMAHRFSRAKPNSIVAVDSQGAGREPYARSGSVFRFSPTEEIIMKTAAQPNGLDLKGRRLG